MPSPAGAEPGMQPDVLPWPQPCLFTASLPVICASAGAGTLLWVALLRYCVLAPAQNSPAVLTLGSPWLPVPQEQLALAVPWQWPCFPSYGALLLSALSTFI